MIGLNSAWLRLTMILLACVGLATFVAVPAYAVAPSNDAITNAVVVSGVPATIATSTVEATSVPGDAPFPCGGATVWYTFTPASSGSYIFDTIGSNYDTTLALFEGPAGSPAFLACNDDTDGLGLQSRIVHALSAGTTYYIEAGTCCGSTATGGGDLVLNVNVDVNVPLDIQLAVTGARVGQPGTVIVRGTVTCNSAATVDVNGSLRQRQGLVITNAFFSTSSACSTVPTIWTATADAGVRIVLPKDATFTATAFGCGLTSCDSASVSRVIKITK